MVNAEELSADFDNHYIEGYAHAAYAQGKDAYFKAPLISHVTTTVTGGELWQGGCMQGVQLPEDFDLVISLYPWEQYALGPETERIEVRAYDSPDQDPTIFLELADLAAAKVEEGSKVLVHCQAGLNRSGVLASLVLRKLGYTSAEAIEELRESRSPLVLCNKAFEEWVLALDEDED